MMTGDFTGFSEVRNSLQFAKHERTRNRGELLTLIKGGMKLIHYPRDPSMDELFNLDSDPREETNLIYDHRKLSNEMISELIERSRLSEAEPTRNVLSEDDKEHLKALGYLGE